ncbi:MAG TPA: DUF202 domain-containing protein [Candidatus Saccharimonadales bacterium]|nr:DUF202 domain-containing protein [Candidatus Saccharimonadales bacterium]
MTADKKRTRSKDTDPDVRFLLANERTLLAWVRTAVAIMAGGVALSQFNKGSSAHALVSILAILLGAFMALIGYMRFKGADKAIRRGELPTAGNEPLIQVGGITVIAGVLVVARLTGIW